MGPPESGVIEASVASSVGELNPSVGMLGGLLGKIGGANFGDTEIVK